MNIGLTYDLRQEYIEAGFDHEAAAEFDSIETIDAIAAVLAGLGHQIDRIGRVHALVQRLARGDRWDLVFNIAEGFHGIGREAQVPALLDAFGIAYTFSDPLVCALTLHKAMTKRVVRDLGLPTPAFAEVSCEADAQSVDLQFPLFAKPVAEGTSKGISHASKITDRDQLIEVCTHLLERFRQPVLVEAYLPGREVTVGIVGTGKRAEVVGVMEVVLYANADPDYTYDNKQQWQDRLTYKLANAALANEAAHLALNVWRGLGCRDGGRVDLRQDPTGRLNFIEVNPLPGVHPTNSDLPILAGLAGWTYQQLIQRIVDSATERMPQANALRFARSGAFHSLVRTCP